MSDKKKLLKCYYLRVFAPPRLAPHQTIAVNLLTLGGLLLGALSLGDTQDCIIGGFHHGGALALTGTELSLTGAKKKIDGCTFQVKVGTSQ